MWWELVRGDSSLIGQGEKGQWYRDDRRLLNTSSRWLGVQVKNVENETIVIVSSAPYLQRVDGKGAVLVVVRSEKKRVFGCFASHGAHFFLFELSRNSPELWCFNNRKFYKAFKKDIEVTVYWVVSIDDNFEGFVTGPKYTGDSFCFLFTLSPFIRVYEPTGFTSDYAYLNFQQETMPNGLVSLIVRYRKRGTESLCDI